MSTEIEGTAAAAAPPQKFTALSRIFHWLTAILIFAALFIGFTMVNWLAGYTGLRGIHMSVGALILLVVCVNLASLTLARASARRHEISTRIALGATPSIFFAPSSGLFYYFYVFDIVTRQQNGEQVFVAANGSDYVIEFMT